MNPVYFVPACCPSPISLNVIYHTTPDGQKMALGKFDEWLAAPSAGIRCTQAIEHTIRGSARSFNWDSREAGIFVSVTGYPGPNFFVRPDCSHKISSPHAHPRFRQKPQNLGWGTLPFPWGRRRSLFDIQGGKCDKVRSLHTEAINATSFRYRCMGYADPYGS